MNQKLRMIRKLSVALVLIAIVEGFSSCEKYSYTPPAVDPLAVWHLQDEIQPIFSANCIGCHGGTVSPDLRDGKSYLALSRGGYVTTPAESSRLYLKMTSSVHSPRSTDADKLKVLYWITQGALNN